MTAHSRGVTPLSEGGECLRAFHLRDKDSLLTPQLVFPLTPNHQPQTFSH